MGTFVELRVSLKELDQDGTRAFEGKVASEPAAIARLSRKRVPDVARVGLESGPTSVWAVEVERALASARKALSSKPVTKCSASSM